MLSGKIENGFWNPTSDSNGSMFIIAMERILISFTCAICWINCMNGVITSDYIFGLMNVSRRISIESRRCALLNVWLYSIPKSIALLYHRWRVVWKSSHFVCAVTSRSSHEQFDECSTDWHWIRFGQHDFAIHSPVFQVETNQNPVSILEFTWFQDLHHWFTGLERSAKETS